jgi:hypothetical protein
MRTRVRCLPAWLLLAHMLAEQGPEPEDIGAKLIRKDDAVAALSGSLGRRCPDRPQALGTQRGRSRPDPSACRRSSQANE